MAEVRAPNPLVEQFRRGGVPRDLRLIAAQGLLPLGPVDLLQLVELLSGDSDAEVAGAAQASLGSFPGEQMLPIVKDRATPPRVLAWALVNRSERELREAVLQNVATDDDVIEQVAPALSTELAELVVINQTRLLRRTGLLQAIESNPSLNRDQQRRLRELRESFGIGAEHAPPAPEPAPPAAPEQTAEATGPAPAPAEAAPEPPPEAPAEEAPLSAQEAVVRILTREEQQQEEKVSAVQRLYRLNTAEKVITALKGNREERAILVRDPNRLVATAVLGSPRVTDAEIESFAGMKNVSDQILRLIGTHKEWTKKYSVISSLVKNPRTPLSVSLTLVSRLNPRDLKGITIDKNVPEVIRKQAQKFVKGPPGQGGAAKH